MESLLRTRVGNFQLDSALTLAQVEELVESNSILEKVCAVDEAFSHLPEIVVPPSLEKKVNNGNSFFYKTTAENDLNGDVRIYRQDGMFIGIYSYSKKKKLFEPNKLFFVEGCKDAILS